MYRNTWLLATVFSILLVGCASQHKTAPVKPKPTPAPPAAKAVGKTVLSADGLIKGEIVGTPAPSSKFAQLQIGMKLEQVKKLIGQPNRTDSRITGKQYQPFYFGGDTERTEAFYKDEGQLTFSNTKPDTPADTLIKIIVNPNASEKH
jgi:hypothetical protein